MRLKKNYTAGEVWQNLSLALHGNKYPHEVLDYLSGWQSLFELNPRPGVYNAELMRHFKQTKKTIADGLNAQHEITRRIFQTALKNRDGSDLRLLADIVDEWENLSDPNRLWLLALCFNWTPPRKQMCRLTCPELVKLASARGWKITQRRMLVLCKELGIKLRKAKEGRPAKTRNS